MTAPPFLPSLAALGWFLGGPLLILAAISVHGWWRERHPRRTDAKERP